MVRLRALGFAMGASLIVVVACSQTQKPLGNGDDFDAAVEDASTPPSQDAANYDDGFFAPVDGYAPPSDAYAPYSWCTKCKCPSDTFCFGGGTGYESFGGDCHTDGGALTSPLSVGCYPIPSGCAHDEDPCACLIQAVSPYVPACYPVCSDTTNIVYCPNP
jgi:hypothetical protein